jgi:hypothetical protein
MGVVGKLDPDSDFSLMEDSEGIDSPRRKLIGCGDILRTNFNSNMQNLANVMEFMFRGFQVPQNAGTKVKLPTDITGGNLGLLSSPTRGLNLRRIISAPRLRSYLRPSMLCIPRLSRAAVLMFTLYSCPLAIAAEVTSQVAKWHPIQLDVTGPRASEADISPNTD